MYKISGQVFKIVFIHALFAQRFRQIVSNDLITFKMHFDANQHSSDVELFVFE